MCDCDCELPERVKWRRIQDEYAAELSDRIRAAGATCVGGDYDGYQAAADLIDPRKP